MKILIILMMFFVIGALFIVTNQNLQIYKQENFSTFSKIYLGWLGDIYSNVIKSTGYFVRLDWLPQ
jgi:hypothetical protein